MRLIDQASRRLFDYILMFHSDDLVGQYGDEMRSVFQDDIHRARQEGGFQVLRVWSDVVREAFVLSTPWCLARAQLVLAATTVASVLTIGTALGFCSLNASPVVHACSTRQTAKILAEQQSPHSDLIQMQNGHHMFLKCSGADNAQPTVILATGRGLGTAESWNGVQQKVDPSIRVCSYDAMGAGKSDPVEGNPQLRPIDLVVEDMHILFETARLSKPYVLVGASDGALLVRRYQQKYAKEIAGLVFADSSHEEMEWRDAAVAPQLDPRWDDPTFLKNNGFLPNHEKLTWRADIPLIDLERSEKAPLSAFPGLTQGQVDAINALWHDFQVDLAARSRFGQLRIVANSGHFMHRDQPGAIADAIRDVVRQVRSEPSR